MQYLIMATNYNGGSIYVVNPQQQSKKIKQKINTTNKDLVRDREIKRE